MCMWVVTLECRISDSDHARAVMTSAARSSSPRPSQQPSGRRRTGPCMGSDDDRTRVLEVIPNTPPDGQVGVIISKVGVAGDMP